MKYFWIVILAPFAWVGMLYKHGTKVMRKQEKYLKQAADWWLK